MSTGRNCGEVGDDADVALGEDGCVLVVVHRGDDPRIADADNMLDGSGDADGQTQLGFTFAPESPSHSGNQSRSDDTGLEQPSCASKSSANDRTRSRSS